MADIFWWVIFPYVTLTIMILGFVYRFAFRQMSWTAPSTEIFEKKWLRIGAPLFHYTLILAFIGHVMGILVPQQVYYFLGISDQTYHMFAIVGGGLVGVLLVIGIVILLIRRFTNERVRVHSTFGDYFSLIALLIVAGTGTYITIVYNLTVVPYDYKATIGPWFRSIFIFQPQYQLMVDVPFLFQLHVVSAFALFAALPFTNMVHFLSLPFAYLRRAPLLYRSRSGYKRKGT